MLLAMKSPDDGRVAAYGYVCGVCVDTCGHVHTAHGGARKARQTDRRGIYIVTQSQKMHGVGE